jgi:hypothetical protein
MNRFMREPIYVQCVVSVALLLSLHVSHGFPVSYRRVTGVRVPFSIKHLYL